ncbi:MAG: response regulator [Anaerolineales bacterium]|nr:response regulator [Anaerolineales bacterium]
MQQSTQENVETICGFSESDHPSLILVIDDEPSFCTVLSEILRSFGYHVQQAHSVDQALQVLEREPPDLILTDIMMPGTDGLTLIRQLRANPRWSSMPMIVVSAKSQPEDIAASEEAGADGCLIKPFSAGELREAVNAHLKPNHNSI